MDELFIGLVYPVGTDKEMVITNIKDILTSKFHYNVEIIKFSNFIETFCKNTNIKDKEDKSIYEYIGIETSNYYEKTNYYMDLGNLLRKNVAASYLSYQAIIDIYKKRNPDKKNVFIFDSFKHPEEIKLLTSLYRDAFYVFSIYSSEENRKNYLINQKEIEGERAQKLINRDKGEKFKFGQQMTEAFQLGDFFIDCNESKNHVYADVDRILKLMHNSPYYTPTVEEYSMFNAYIAGTKSADLSRQVGALISNEFGDILSTGSNDCVQPFNGQYWPFYDKESERYDDSANGRDYKIGFDPNKKEIQNIKNNIIKIYQDKIKERITDLSTETLSEMSHSLEKTLEESTINSITEYGRIVHAEMNAILSCARNDIAIKNTVLYCTTFPCHNCAKHIVASGIEKVVYIEPYPKSKTLDFYVDSIVSSAPSADCKEKVGFVPFIGVGPNKYLEMFSMNYKGNKRVRKKENKVIDSNEWVPKLRNNMNFSIYEKNEIGHIEGVEESSSEINVELELIDRIKNKDNWND